MSTINITERDEQHHQHRLLTKEEIREKNRLAAIASRKRSKEHVMVLEKGEKNSSYIFFL
jgi:hypothetical protein